MICEVEQDIAFERIVQLLGCKWSVRILSELVEGPRRPSEILRSQDGLAPRVLHRCLGRMSKDGLVHKHVFATVPPHTEYTLTPDGMEFVNLLKSAQRLAETWKGTQGPVRLRE